MQKYSPLKASLVPVVLVMALSINLGLATFSVAAEKAGQKCTSFGKSVVKGKTKLTCVRVTEYKWTATPIKPPLGSVFNPVNPGVKLKLNSLAFQTGQVNFEFGEEVCSENFFNSGCKYDTLLKSSVDPESTKRWIGIDLIISNLTTKIIGAVDLNYSYYIILPNGKYIENEREVSYKNSPIEIELLPSVATSMRIGFYLPKDVINLNPIIVVRDDSGKSSKEYFFYLNW